MLAAAVMPLRIFTTIWLVVSYASPIVVVVLRLERRLFGDRADGLASALLYFRAPELLNRMEAAAQDAGTAA